MISTTCPDQANTFFAILENTPELDLRDPRGKRHPIAVVLLGLTLALLSKRDGSLSSLHRHMLHHYPGLCQAINRPVFRPISRAQLPLVLARVDGSTFSQLINNYYSQVRWQDPPGQTNFYRVAGYNDYQFVNELAGNSSERGRGNWYFNTSSLFTDVGRDGQAFLVTKGNLITPSRMVNGIRYVSRPVGQLTAILLNVDQNYYQYHEAIERQLQVSDNAFAEPALIPSTIIGGLGCFGAFNQSTLTVDVK